MSGVFITATSTEIGKTYTACAIARALKKIKVNVGVFKPFATGDLNDAKQLIKASGVKETPEAVTPEFCALPMSPYIAAKLEGKKLNINKVLSAYKRMAKKYEFMIVEGAGGLMVPIEKNFFIDDLIKKLNLPAIVVASRSLGTINHTLLTVERLKQRKIPVLGIVVNACAKKDISSKYNAALLKQFTKLPITELKHNGKIKDIKWILKA